jgi:hypothetical protein
MVAPQEKKFPTQEIIGGEKSGQDGRQQTEADAYSDAEMKVKEGVFHGLIISRRS